MADSLEFELLPYLEQIADVCIGNTSPDNVGAGELSTLPETLALIQYNQKNKEYAKHGIRKVQILEDMVVRLRNQLEMLSKKQELGQVKSD